VSKLTRWTVGYAAGREIVEAADQHAAWNTLRNRPLEDFGLIVTALREGDDEGERIAVHTTALLLTWGRDDEARFLLDALAAAGVDDAPADYAYAQAHGRPELVGPVP
jgi:hypothetical protein